MDCTRVPHEVRVRQVDQTAGDSQTESEDSGQHSAIRFNANIFIGNLGESLKFGDSDDSDDMDDRNGESGVAQVSNAELAIVGYSVSA